ncbi:YopX family protein [Streptococcus agalactiae]
MIKFRAWVKESKKMIHVGSIDLANKVIYYSYWQQSEEGNNLFGDAITFDETVLMQSTGLFDTNGVEVFEGDVVTAWSQGVKGTFEIKRRIDGLWLLCPAWKDGEFWYLSPTEDGCETIEIIGNVYQNSELLESVEE